MNATYIIILCSISQSIIYTRCIYYLSILQDENMYEVFMLSMVAIYVW